MIMSGRDARGPEDHDAPLEWRASSDDTIPSGRYALYAFSSLTASVQAAIVWSMSARSWARLT